MRKALLPLLVALFLLAVVLPGSVISAPPNATPTVVPPSYATYLPLVAGSEAGNLPPEVPSGPSPADGATDVPVLTSLSWTGSDPDGDSLTYDVYLGTATPPATLVCVGVAESGCVPSLELATTYTWQVVATDSGGAQTSGPVWSFTTEETSTADAFAAEVVRLVNEERATAGCDPLTVDARLQAAALGHSQDMALNDFFAHTGSDGSSVVDRVDDQGYDWSMLGENIAAGYATPAAAVEGWMNSDGHRANILNCDFTETGVGYYYLEDDGGVEDYHHYWTHVFARPLS